MIIELTKTRLFANGDRCSSITVTKMIDGRFEVVMFDNPKYVKNKIKIDRLLGKIKYRTGVRTTKIFRNVVFQGMKPRKQKGSIANYHLKTQGKIFFSSKNKVENYINYYEEVNKK